MGPSTKESVGVEESDSANLDVNASSSPPPLPPRPSRNAGLLQKQASTKFEYNIFGDSRMKSVTGDRQSLRTPSVPSTHESETGWGAGEESSYQSPSEGKVPIRVL